MPDQLATRGCLILNTFMELNDLDDAAEVVRGYCRRVRAAIHKSLAAMAGPVRDIDSTADILTNGQIGLIVTSRIDPPRPPPWPNPSPPTSPIGERSRETTIVDRSAQQAHSTGTPCTPIRHCLGRGAMV